MSWSLNATSTNKEAIKKEIRDQKYMPEKLKDFLCEHVDSRDAPLQSDQGSFAVQVLSTGHEDKNYCYGDFKVQLTKVV